MSDASLAQPWSTPLIDMPGFAHYYATVTEVADVDIAVIADRYTTLSRSPAGPGSSKGSYSP